MSWTEERVELLKALWTKGSSASEIAAELGGGISRNAVLGKVDRLKLAKRGRRQPRPRESKPGARLRFRSANRIIYIQGLAGPKRVPPTPLPAEEISKNPVNFMGLTNKNCHWPINDNPPFIFCGDAAIEGQPYCAHHYRIGHQPVRQVSAAVSEYLVRRFTHSSKPSAEPAPPLAPEEMVA